MAWMIREKFSLFGAASHGKGGGGGYSPPPAPDPAATAAAQATANKEAAVAQSELNMINQYTPQGKVEYTQRGTSAEGTPQYSATQTYSPEQQALYDLTTQAGQKFGETANTQLDAVRGRLSQPLDFSGLGAAPTMSEATRQSVANSMYERLNPQFDRDRSALETQLANQGITMGSAAYNTAMDEINRSRNDARLAVDTQAGNEASRLFSLESAARDRAINEMVQQRQVPLNELSAMLSGSQVQGPQFVSVPTAQVNAPDIMGATYNAYNTQVQAGMANAQQQAAQRSAGTSGLYGLLGSGAMAAGMFF
jgi:hypothetical protein